MLCVFISNDAYQKVGTRIEHAVKILLYGCSISVGEEITIRIIHPPYA
jgi:hypothetical protein